MMTNAETLAELIHKHRGVKRVVSYLEGESNERVVGYDELYERALGILYSPAEAGREAGRQAHPLPRQQRAISRCLLGRHAGRDRARAGCARHQRRAQTQAAAHRQEAGQTVHLHRPEDSGSHRCLCRRGRRAGNFRRPRLARLLRRAGRRHLEGRPGARRQTRRHGLHPVLLRLHQRTQGRGAHPSQYPRERARLR